MKIGTILLDLSASGKTPVIMLLLKMWASGVQISLAMCLSREELIPSISVLEEEKG